MSERACTARRVFSVLCVLVGAAFLAACHEAIHEGGGGDVQHYRHADRVIVALPISARAADGSYTLAAWPPEPPPVDSARWQGVALPDARPGSDGETRGASIPEVAWYRVEWHGAGRMAKPTDIVPVALYVPRALGWGVVVWRLDGARWVPVSDNAPEAWEQWNRPLLVTLPPEADAFERGVTLAVGLPLRDGRNALASLWVGPLETLRVRADIRRALQLGIPSSATLAMGVLGLLSLGVWVGRRKEPAYLYFALACLLWSVRNLHYFVDVPRDDLAYQWFWGITNASISWVMLAMYQFAFCFDTRRHPRLMITFVVINVVAALANLASSGSVALLFQHGVNVAASVFVTASLTVLAVRGGSRELRVITAALWISAAFGIHDFLLLDLIVSPESIYLLPYASIVLICSFLYAGMRRFIGAVAQAETANAVLAIRLEERERELRANHDKLRRVEREQAVLLERQRIMRDMHDGVGSALISTLRVVERGELSSLGVADVLRGAVDDLRMAIDSLEPIEHDLTTLLATLRLRMGRRLEAAGMLLHWDMADLPPLPWLDSPQAVQVLRLLQEALSNAIQHAKAHSVRISAAIAEAFVRVEVADDGIGVGSTAKSNGRGLTNMRHRATALGGRLEIVAGEPHGTVVRLWLPLQQDAGTTPPGPVPTAPALPHAEI